jgi:hypothetical protein
MLLGKDESTESEMSLNEPQLGWLQLHTCSIFGMECNCNDVSPSLWGGNG